MTINAISSTKPIGMAGIGAAPLSWDGASLLPDPCENACPSDGLALIYAQISSMGRASLTQNTKDAAGHQKIEKEIAKEEREALERARRAQGEGSRGFFGSIGHLVGDVLDDVSHLRLADAVNDVKDDTVEMVNSPKFWQDLAKGAATIAKWAALVGTVAMGTAAIIASGGAAATIVIAGGGMALSVAGFAAQELAENDVVKWAGLGMNLAGGLTAGISSSLAEKAASELAKSVMVVGGVAVAAGGGSCIVAGSSTMASGKFEETATHAFADAKAARMAMERQERAILELLDFANGMQKSNRRALESAQSAIQTRDDALLTATSMKG